MPDLTEAEKKALKEKNRIIKLELEMEREMNKNKEPNPFDVKKLKSGGRIKFRGGGSTNKGMNKNTYGSNS
jgi:hypothetical protein|tara:strand:+ start:39 stop:251 length:213 start_codon:yes stop_codon:yes gene_type:complete